MATQDIKVVLHAEDQAEYEKIKIKLAALNLPAKPIFNDLLKEVYINFTEKFNFPD